MESLEFSSKVNHFFARILPEYNKCLV